MFWRRRLAKGKRQADLGPSLETQAAARVIAGAMIGLQVQLTWEPDIDISASHRAFISMVTGPFWQSVPSR